MLRSPKGRRSCLAFAFSRLLSAGINDRRRSPQRSTAASCACAHHPLLVFDPISCGISRQSNFCTHNIRRSVECVNEMDIQSSRQEARSLPCARSNMKWNARAGRASFRQANAPNVHLRYPQNKKLRLDDRRTTFRTSRLGYLSTVPKFQQIEVRVEAPPSLRLSPPMRLSDGRCTLKSSFGVRPSPYHTRRDAGLASCVLRTALLA